jgi:nucleotide-binding universal stress UspA family protein
MLTTIVVPLDGTPLSLAALPLARVQAQAHGARLVLLRVVPATAAPDDPLLKQVETDLPLTAVTLAGNGVLVEVVCARAGRAEDLPAAILREAHACRADLLVIAAPADQAGDPVTDVVLAESDLPVLLVRATRWTAAALQPRMLLLVAVDGTPADRAALTAAAMCARVTQSELTVLRVVLTRAGDLARYADFAALSDARTSVAAQVRRLRAAGICSQRLAQFGVGPSAVAQRLNAGLVILGMPTHGGPVCGAWSRDAVTIAQPLAGPVIYADQPATRVRAGPAPDRWYPPVMVAQS